MPSKVPDDDGGYSSYRSTPAPGISFFTPQQTLPCGTAILDEENGITEDTISPVFKPLKIRNTVFQNRIFLAPMCLYSCKDGMLSDFHVAHYGQYAIRGVPLITIEATAVVPWVRVLQRPPPPIQVFFCSIDRFVLQRASIHHKTVDSGPMNRSPP
jgi:hypothetical protein